MPTRHPYVDHIQAIGTKYSEQYLRASDILRVDWLRENLNTFDIVHIHFQLHEVTVDGLSQCIQFMQNTTKKIVYTAHDLTDPQVDLSILHELKLKLLMATADEIYTLTKGASDEIRYRWQRNALVLPHPHVLPFDLIDAPKDLRNGVPVVGLHLKSGRPGLTISPVLKVLLAICDPTQWKLQIDMNRDGIGRLVEREPGLESLLDLAAITPGVNIKTHERFTEQEFFSYVRTISVAVLPYERGTHSGWAEACLDAGTMVIAPSQTYIPDQNCVIQPFDIRSADSLANGLTSALRSRGRIPWTRYGRARQRCQIASELRKGYRGLIS